MNADEAIARYRLARQLLVLPHQLVGPRLACNHFFSLGCALRCSAGPAFSPCPESDRACVGPGLEQIVPFSGRVTFCQHIIFRELNPCTHWCVRCGATRGLIKPDADDGSARDEWSKWSSPQWVRRRRRARRAARRPPAAPRKQLPFSFD